MKKKIAIITLALISGTVLFGSVYAKSDIPFDITQTMNTSSSAIDINSALTVDSLCVYLDEWFTDEYTKANLYSDTQCYTNNTEKYISAIGNSGVLKTLGLFDKYNPVLEITNNELCKILFDIIVQLDKSPKEFVGTQLKITDTEYLNELTVLNSIGLIGEDYDGEKIPTNQEAYILIRGVGDYLRSTQQTELKDIDMTATNDLGILTNNKEIDITYKQTRGKGIITSAKYKQPESLFELAENWRCIPIIDNYRLDNKIGFLNIWEGIANPENLETYAGEVEDMVISNYPSGSILWYNIGEDKVELRHPDYMTIGYRNSMTKSVPPDTQIYTIKDYQITGVGTLNWVDSDIHINKKQYLEADCLGFVVDRSCITGNEEDNGKLTLVVAQIPEFDKDHFRKG